MKIFYNLFVIIKYLIIKVKQTFIYSSKFKIQIIFAKPYKLISQNSFSIKFYANFKCIVTQMKHYLCFSVYFVIYNKLMQCTKIKNYILKNTNFN